MAGSNRPELRLMYRIFVAVNILLAVYNMICFQMPRNDVKPCVLVMANLSQPEAADAARFPASPQPVKVASASVRKASVSEQAAPPVEAGHDSSAGHQRATG
ncbi:hypothetical protein HPB48_013314 [Haemaphysalis longicornis]|uniref:Uncharacterized protein n=1 Tax=Haemaphysalis longicornis TaxID=44386 RepID=A0A9J6GM87_HAELO|nr:hypothetical protein HPB48_013314 [Haemaphysalis longicornis]